MVSFGAMMSPLNLKLLREVWRLRGQMISIALIVATGIMAVITMRGSYDSLVDAQQHYYRESRFADVWAPLKRAPVSVRERLHRLPGVTAVDTRVTQVARLDLAGLDAPAQALFVSLPVFGRARLNDIRVAKGRYIAPGKPGEVLINTKFAQARKLGPGDMLSAIINGRARQLIIVGTANSPEHAYAVPPGSIFPDDERYGVIWMARDELAAAFNMDGAFNEAVLTLGPEANQEAVLQAVDEILDPYGGLGAYPRAEQLSHQILQGELDQNKVMGTAIPVVFLTVAAFLLNLVLGRLIATQRSEIALLKAFGYRNSEVAWHYLMFALVAVLLGALIGVISGIWLGHGYVAMYGAYFSFPELRYKLSVPLVLIAVVSSALAAIAGALLAARRAALLPPAEAMRAEPPVSYQAGLLERLGLAARLPSSLRMILRNVGRKPVQTVLSSVGVAFSVAILVIGLFMFDGVRYMMELQFRQIQREDITLSFFESKARATRFDLKHLPGVTAIETFRAVPARLRAGHREREVALLGLEPDGRMRRVIDSAGRVRDIPARGALLSRKLANDLNVSAGDPLEVEVLEGRRAHGQILVAGVVEDFLGLSASMSADSLLKLTGGADVISGAYLTVEQDKRGELERYLKRLPAAASVTSPASTLATFEKQLADSLFIAVGFLLGFASVISIGVVYNGARLSLSERGREMASLRVMGFRRGEVTVLLLGEQAIVTLVAIPFGWLLGYGLSRLIVTAIQTDTYRIPFMISLNTYLISAAVVVLTAVISSAIVRWRINRLDLIAVLKTRE